jgi:hypothetical protein
VSLDGGYTCNTVTMRQLWGVCDVVQLDRHTVTACITVQRPGAPMPRLPSVVEVYFSGEHPQHMAAMAWVRKVSCM